MDSNVGKQAVHPFVASIRAGELEREVLEPLVAADLAALEAQYRPKQSMWSHYDPGAREPDEGVVAAFAAFAGDEALWRRLVEHLVSKDFALRKEQKWSGVDPEDLGRVPTMAICAERLRSSANQVLEGAPDAREAAAPFLDRWQEAVAAEDRAAEQQRESGQQIQDPPPRIRKERDWSKHPDLAAESARVYAELRSRDAENMFGPFTDPRYFCWSGAQFPDIEAAFERLEDELDRREGITRPVIRVKVGDTVVANGKRWKVTGVNARLNVADLEWSEGTTSYSIPATADALVPEE